MSTRLAGLFYNKALKLVLYLDYCAIIDNEVGIRIKEAVGLNTEEFSNDVDCNNTIECTFVE